MADRSAQACAIPYRLTAPSRVEFLLVTTGTGKWTLPKGHIEPGDNSARTARAEAYEEAGVLGIATDPIGTFSYMKRQQTKNVVVHPLVVRTLATDWPERHLRERCWMSLVMATSLVHLPQMAGALHQFVSMCQARAVV